MNNALVTGGAGFIGTNFVHFLHDKDPEIHIVNLDLLTYAGNLENLKDIENHDNYTFIHGDIRDSTTVIQIFTEFNIDTVVHFAAESHVDRSILSPSAFIETNIFGTFTLLEAARGFWGDNFSGKRFHHVSTDEVFGSLEPQDPPFTENTPYNPRSPYSASKASSDHLVRSYYHTYNLPITITNCTNNYGPYQYPEKLIPVIIFNCLQGNTIPVYGDGKQIRDWLYVSDHCEAIHQVLINGLVGETYLIGGKNQPTNIEIIRKICKILDAQLPDSPYLPHESLITFVPDRPGHDRRYAMDISKIIGELDWEPKETLDSGLSKTIEWYLNNLAWASKIREEKSYGEWINQNYSQRN